MTVKAFIKRYRLSSYHIKAIRNLTACLLTFIAGATLFALRLERKQTQLASHAESAVALAAPTLTLLTFASHQADFLCHLLTTAILNDIPIKVLGYDNNREHVLFRKIPATLSELKQRQPDEIVLFVDAFDVLITGSAENIVSEFLKLEANIVFAAEKGCWPFMDGRPEGRLICEEEYPESSTPYKYLNSGVWIGYVHAAIQVFEQMMLLPEAEARAIDQELASIVFLNQRDHYRMTLDYSARIVQCAHLSADDLEIRQTGQRKVAFNVRTQTFPSILHFNGNGKEFQEAYHEQLELNHLPSADIEKIQSRTDLVQGISYLQACPINH